MADVMAGAYCTYCDHRCFVYRIVPGSRVTHLATCPEGAAHDREYLGGFDYTNTVNPHDPQLAHPVAEEAMTNKYIGNRGIAKIIGTDASTVRSYRRYGYLPDPEVMIDDTPGWTVETIERWQASRPGLNRRPYSRNPLPTAGEEGT